MNKPKSKQKQAKRQVKFECSEEFYQRVMGEKLKRNLTVQQLAIRALERYFAIPEYLHRSIEVVAENMAQSVDEVVQEAFEKQISRHQKLVAHQVPKSFPTVEALRKSFEDVRKSPGIFLPSSAEDQRAAFEHFSLWKDIWEYALQLPAEKVRLLHESLALDLKYYKSARIKPKEPRELEEGK